MSELVQFVVLQRSEKWVVKSRELERAFGDRRKAIYCAVELGTGSRRWYWPALAAMNLHRFGPSARNPYPLARSVSRRLAKIERPKIDGPKIDRPARRAG